MLDHHHAQQPIEPSPDAVTPSNAAARRPLLPPDYFRDLAISYARAGWRVFPVAAGAKNPPLFEGWPDKASSDPALARERWTLRDGTAAEYNVGLATGNFAVVDLDTRGDDGAVDDAHEKLGLNGDSYSVRTPSGGLHEYYAAPSGGVPCSVKRVHPAVDIRGNGGYVLAPGSYTIADGKTAEGFYAAVNPGAPILPAPQSLIDRVARVTAAPRPAADRVAFDEDTPDKLQHGKRIILATPGAAKGSRGATTLKLAMELRDHGLSETAAVELLCEFWAEKCSPPLDLKPSASDDQGIEIIVANAYRYAKNAAGSKTPEAQFGDRKVIMPVDTPPPPPPLVGADTPASARFAPLDSVRFGNAVLLADLKPRDWILRGFLIRGEVAALIAPGGVGKSQASIMAAIALARGESFLSFDNPATYPQKTVIYNAEDSVAEMSMRLHAQCIHDRIDPASVIPHIMLVSGREGLSSRFRITRADPDNPRNHAFSRADVDKLIECMGGFDPALIVLDPLAKLHEVNESDNSAMTRVMEAVEMLADMTNCPVLVCHHTSKAAGQSSSGIAGNVDSARGASAIKDSARACFTLSAPSEADVGRFGLDTTQALRYLRMDDAKMNRGLASLEPQWLRKRSVRLHTGEEVGAFELVAAPGNAAFLNVADDAARADAVFVALLRRCGEQGLFVGMAKQGAYAPRIFSQRPDRDGLTAKALEAAMHRLLTVGAIRIAGYRAENRHRGSRIEIVSEPFPTEGKA